MYPIEFEDKRLKRAISTPQKISANNLGLISEFGVEMLNIFKFSAKNEGILYA